MLNNITKITAFILGLLCLSVFSCADSSNNTEELVNYMDTPAGEDSSLPFLYAEGGEMLMSWVERKGDTTTLKYSSLKAEKWSEPVAVISGQDWFVNWADFAAITQNKDMILSHVLKKSTKETNSYDVKLNLSHQKNGFEKIDFLLNTDGTNTEHGFVTMLPYKENSFFVCWLDGRNTGGEGHGTGAHQGAMSIRSAEVAASGDITNEIELDNKVCDCCQTTAAITDNGPVVVYRDRSDEEHRDMSIVRWVEGNWTTPKTIFYDNWKIEGCPVNGPKAAAMGNDLAIAWFTAANKEPKVKVIFSNDAGENFETPIIVSETNPAGRVDIAMIDKENILVSWLESVEAGNQLKVVRVHKTGKKSNPQLVAMVHGSRKSGFPQMELAGGKVYFAWTDINDDSSIVKIAFVQLKNL